MDETISMAERLGQLKEKYNKLQKQYGDIQNELLTSEKEKLEFSKNLIDLQIENQNLLNNVKNNEFEISTKL